VLLVLVRLIVIKNFNCAINRSAALVSCCLFE